jgi:hypothetical protein
VTNFWNKWQNTFTFVSCAYCLYSGSRSDFKNISDCEPFSLLVYKCIEDEYFSMLRSSRLHQLVKAADQLECQLNSNGSFPGTIKLFLLI